MLQIFAPKIIKKLLRSDKKWILTIVCHSGAQTRFYDNFVKFRVETQLGCPRKSYLCIPLDLGISTQACCIFWTHFTARDVAHCYEKHTFAYYEFRRENSNF